MQRLVGRDKKGKRILINVPSWNDYIPSYTTLQSIAITQVGTAASVNSNGPYVVNFDEFTTRANFSSSSLGNVTQTYKGFVWGYTHPFSSSGWGSAFYPTAGTNTIGWASATNSSASFLAFPILASSGTGYAWNQSSAKSLWIDFQKNVSLNSIRVAPSKNSIAGNNNAPSLTFSAYNGSGTLLASSSIIQDLITFSWQKKQFGTEYGNTRYLEITATTNPANTSSGQFFTVDELVVGY